MTCFEDPDKRWQLFDDRRCLERRSQTQLTTSLKGCAILTRKETEGNLINTQTQICKNTTSKYKYKYTEEDKFDYENSWHFHKKGTIWWESIYDNWWKVEESRFHWKLNWTLNIESKPLKCATGLPKYKNYKYKYKRKIHRYLTWN